MKKHLKAVVRRQKASLSNQPASVGTYASKHWIYLERLIQIGTGVSIILAALAFQWDLHDRRLARDVAEATLREIEEASLARERDQELNAATLNSIEEQGVVNQAILQDIEETRNFRQAQQQIEIVDSNWDTLFSTTSGSRAKRRALEFLLLSDIDLQGIILSCSELAGIDAWNQEELRCNRRVSLNMIDFAQHGVHLGAVDFSGISLNNSNFTALNLQGSSFVGATLVQTDFVDAELSGADFRNSNIHGADFSNAHISGAIIPDISGFNANPPILEGAWAWSNYLPHVMNVEVDICPIITLDSGQNWYTKPDGCITTRF